jgi:hypothetical protein
MFLVILFTNCGKDFEKFTPRETTGLVEDIFNNFSSEVEVFEIKSSSSSDIILETKKGSVIFINRTNLILNGAEIDPESTLRIEVKEISGKGEMITNNLSTNTSSKLLISERMFKISIKVEDEEVQLQSGKEYKICVPNTQPDASMKLFYGTTDTGNRTIWEEAEDTRAIELNEWFFQTDMGVLTDFGYVLSVDRFDWINIDKYNDIPDEEKVEIRVQVPLDIYNGQNSIVFMVFIDNNSVVGLQFDQNTGEFYEPYGASPEGEEVSFVILSAISADEYQLGIKNTTIQHGLSYLLAPQPLTKEEIKTRLEKL